jgi:hypothetical protein
MGKGSRSRPFEVDKEEFANSWDRIFGKKDKEKDIKEEKLDKSEPETDESTKTK